MSSLMVGIGGRIRKARERAGITQKALGSLIGRTESSIAKYEQGKVVIPLDVVHRIAEVLHFDVGALLGEEVRSFFWMNALEDKLKQIGYSTGAYEEGPNLWINYPDGTQLQVTDTELKALNEASDAYLRFLLEDLRKRLTKNLPPEEGE